MLDWFLGSAFIVGTFAWMGFLENESSWLREGVKFLLMAAVFVGLLVVFFWAAQEYGYFQN